MPSISNSTSINNIILSSKNYVNNREKRNISPTAKNKVMNPVEIANLTEKDDYTINKINREV